MFSDYISYSAMLVVRYRISKFFFPFCSTKYSDGIDYRIKLMARQYNMELIKV